MRARLCVCVCVCVCTDPNPTPQRIEGVSVIKTCLLTGIISLKGNYPPLFGVSYVSRNEIFTCTP